MSKDIWNAFFLLDFALWLFPKTCSTVSAYQMHDLVTRVLPRFRLFFCEFSFILLWFGLGCFIKLNSKECSTIRSIITTAKNYNLKGAGITNKWIIEHKSMKKLNFSLFFQLQLSNSKTVSDLLPGTIYKVQVSRNSTRKCLCYSASIISRKGS